MRVGGPLTREQQRLAEQLDVADAMVQLPFLERPQLAALYRRASVVVLPSDREGFGLAGRRGDGMRYAGGRQRHTRRCVKSAAMRRSTAPRETSADGSRRWREFQREQADPVARASAGVRRASTAAAKFDWRTYAAQMAALYMQPIARERAS